MHPGWAHGVPLTAGGPATGAAVAVAAGSGALGAVEGAAGIPQTSQ